jgi:hypothetical protein
MKKYRNKETGEIQEIRFFDDHLYAYISDGHFTCKAVTMEEFNNQYEEVTNDK